MSRWGLLPLLLVGCGAGDPQGDCALSDDPTLEIGAGATTFETLQDGDPIELVHGPQGGYHLEIALRGFGIDGSDLVAGSMSGTIGGQGLASSKPWLDFRCNAETGTLDALGTNLIYDAQPADLDGQTTEVLISITDASGTVVEDTATLLIEDPLYP